MTSESEHQEPDFYTYMYHPESDAYLAVQNKELDAFYGSADGALCNPISIDDYLKMVTDAKELPKEIRGILKNAEWAKSPYPEDVLHGELWFDPKNQFPDGIRIYTSRVTDIRSDGVYVTSHSKYFVQFKDGIQARNPK